MRTRIMLFHLVLAAMLFSSGAAMAKETDEQKRETVSKMANETLDQLYKLQPSSQADVKKSAGYAVFDNMGVHVLLVSSAHGSGVAVNTITKKKTFMKMLSAGAGLGLGVKDYRVVFVFENHKALDDFINSGWQASTDADAAAKSKTHGAAYSGAVAVAPGVWVYQITKEGLALQLTLQGTKYYKDNDLNQN
jgi:lipid-binding SYLF domain-containing protein